jgi:hypothetical protein
MGTGRIVAMTVRTTARTGAATLRAITVTLPDT